VAGQTAPSPGITIIKGGIGIQTNDVILQHLRARPGEAGAAKKSGWEVDAIATSGGAHDVVIDHCSTSWATDENLSASGERFSGATVEEWRKGTSHRVTISHCVIAEGLDHSTHGKGAHSKGSLIHDNATDIAVIANLYASNGQRNPYFKGGARGVVVNNLIDNPGSAAIRQAMKQSYAVVLCLSAETEARTASGIYPEAADAIDAYRQYPPGSVFLIPVRLSRCEIAPVEIDATRTLDRIHYVDLFPASTWDDGVRRLVQGIQTAPDHP